ncbi:M48 family metallopeptidase [Halovivax gelatinilyticus]|uniref:M48 family metallopeptidase n=1 Tax=Halovivax gelatinilyticus TaxID=2961597 RepID=UPI0020CA88B1|nr:M56 family metallopeptidase [Halovivax gelatinilyticus]
MVLRPDRRLQVRIAGALALVLTVNAVVVAAAGWTLVRGVSASGRSESVEFGLWASVGAILLGAVGLVAYQSRYGSNAVLAELDVDRVESDGPRGVGTRVSRLAVQAGVPAPAVAVADRDEPTCLTVRTRREPTIVVTAGLLDRLADDELDAALAHEVAHVANRDLAVVSAVAATVRIGDRQLEREGMIRRVLHVVGWAAMVSGIGVVLFAIPIVVLGTLYLLVSAVSRTILAVNAITLGLFAKTREYAADHGAVQLTGDPAALASALETLDDGGRPETDKRLHASATLGIVPRPLRLDQPGDDERHWIEPWLPSSELTPDSTEPEPDRPASVVDRIGAQIGEWIRARFVRPITTRVRRYAWVPLRSRVRRLRRWRPATHPNTDDRIDRLRAIERERRG